MNTSDDIGQAASCPVFEVSNGDKQRNSSSSHGSPGGLVGNRYVLATNHALQLVHNLNDVYSYFAAL